MQFSRFCQLVVHIERKRFKKSPLEKRIMIIIARCHSYYKPTDYNFSGFVNRGFTNACKITKTNRSVQGEILKS